MTAVKPTTYRRHGLFPRVEQFVATLTHRHSDEIDQRLQALLGDDAQWRLVARLAPYDRTHHLQVHDLLVARGCTDPDLLRAALLHDVGKARGRRRVCRWHRVARVVGRWVSPRLWRRLSHTPNRVTLGLYLTEHHARLGAASVRAIGVSERCCNLIARHEDPQPTGDALLDALIAADEEA